MKYQLNQEGKYCNLKHYTTKYVVLPLALTGLAGAAIVSNGCASLPKKQATVALEEKALDSDETQSYQDKNKKREELFGTSDDFWKGVVKEFLKNPFR